jgi:uncharacterized protein DUF1524
VFRLSRRRTAYAGIAVLLGAAVACTPGLGGLDSVEDRVPAGTLDPAAATQALQRLPVAPAADIAGYDRDCGRGHGCVFGPAWSDDVEVAGGHNGCDTRNDLLNRDLQAGEVDGAPAPKRLREPGHCVVIEGVLADPYTGKTIHFTKEQAGAVQIDHVVPLADAWRAGAAGWDPNRRRNFANDPLNLLVVDGATNQGKGDATADEWLPPNNAYHCEYARVVVTVKTQYQLSVTAPEQAALQTTLAQCPPPSPTATTPTR